MKPRLVFILVLALVMLGTGTALAVGSYNLSWWTAAGGGGTSTSLSPGYSLAGAAGQPDAGELSGTGFQLSGGFWVGGVAGPLPGGNGLYLPLVVK